MTDTKSPITDPEEFLKLSAEQLDNVFRNAPAGAIPIGQGDGTAIVGTGTAVSDTVAKFVHIFTWKGKVFEPDPVDPQRATLKNRLFLLGTKAIVAEVYRGESWLDGQECIVWTILRPPSWHSGFATKFEKLVSVFTWVLFTGARKSRRRINSFTLR